MRNVNQKKSLKDKILDLFNHKLDEELKEKYIELLEKEKTSFELVKLYHARCRDLTDDKRELKRGLAIANETINELNEELQKATKKIEKLKKQDKEK